jgi:hypothetical protein
MEPNDFSAQGGEMPPTTPAGSDGAPFADQQAAWASDTPTSADVPAAAMPPSAPPMYATPASTPPVFPVQGADAAASMAPPSRTNPGLRTLVLAGIGALVVVALAIAGIAFARSAIAQTGTPTPSQILASATSANLNDAAYTFTDALALSYTQAGSTTTGEPTTFNLMGSGKLTKSPARNDITLTIPLFGSQNSIEAITDGSDLYVNPGNLASVLGGSQGATLNGKWIKIPVGMQIPTVLDYSHLKNLKLIGGETVNGKDTWHIQGTLSAPSGSGTSSADPGASATATAVATQYGLSVQPVTEDLWFAKDTYFPVQFKLHFAASVAKAPAIGGGKATGSGPASVTSDGTVTFTQWNSGLTITVPANVINVSDIPGMQGMTKMAIPGVAGLTGIFTPALGGR